MFRKATLPIALCALGLLLSAGPAAAQANKGDSEVLMQGFVGMNPEAAADSAFGNFTFTYGVYVTNGLELGVGPSITITTDSTSMGMNLFVLQHFGRARVTPYVGADFRSYDIEDDSQGFFGFNGGLKNYLSERAALDLRVAYGVQAVEPAPGFGRAKNLQFSIGLSVLF